MSKSFKWWSIFAGIISIFAGFYMLTRPAASLASLAWFFAFILLFNGVAEIVKYFSKDSVKSGWVLLHGIVTLLLSLCLLSGNFLNLVMFIPYIFAIWVLFSGISKIMISFVARKEEKKAGNMLLFLGILGIIAGIIMLSHPLMTGIMVAYTIGFIFIYNGISSLILAFKGNGE